MLFLRQHAAPFLGLLLFCLMVPEAWADPIPERPPKEQCTPLASLIERIRTSNVQSAACSYVFKKPKRETETVVATNTVVKTTTEIETSVKEGTRSSTIIQTSTISVIKSTTKTITLSSTERETVSSTKTISKTKVVTQTGGAKRTKAVDKRGATAVAHVISSPSVFPILSRVVGKNEKRQRPPTSSWYTDIDQEELRSACSCFGGAPTEGSTVTVTKTSFATETDFYTKTRTIGSTSYQYLNSSSTSLVTRTSVEATTLTSSFVTTLSITRVVSETETATSTKTIYPDCSGIGHKTGLKPGKGDEIQVITGVDAKQDCCELCQTTENCLANAYQIFQAPFGAECQLLLKTVGGDGGEGSCPLGYSDLKFGKPVPSGIVYPGPCGM